MSRGRAADGGDAKAAAPRFATVGRGRIFHYDVGNGEPVVLLHGYNHHAEAWIRNIGPLAAAGWRVIALDLPGFGRSGVPAMRYSLPGYAGFLVDFLDTLGVGSAHLVGSSMGGAIALRMAVDHPDRVPTVTGVDAAGFFTSVPWFWSIAANPVVKTLVRPLLGQRRLLPWARSPAFHHSTLSFNQPSRPVGRAFPPPRAKDHNPGGGAEKLRG